MKKIAFFFLFVFIVSNVSCGGGGKKDTGATYPLETSATIGTSGGTVEVTDPSSPLYGVKVEIPAGALSYNTTISISVQNADTLLPDYLKKTSAIISLTPEGTYFNIPISVSIPYNANNVTDINKIGVYTYDENTSSWSILTLQDIGGSSIKALTQHFSSFLLAEYIKALSNEKDTGFRPGINGFSNDNFADNLDQKGHCWGMVAFAAWYWQYMRSDANLSSKYSICEAKNVINETQHILSDSVKAFYNIPYHSADYVANALMIGIGDLKMPQLLGLYKDIPVDHVVLVYKYVKNDDSSITFYVYEPNPPHDNLTHDNRINYKNGTFESYDSYSNYRFIGGLFNLSSYQSIYHLAMMPIIDSPSPIGTVSSKRPTISASLKSPLPYNRGIEISSVTVTFDNSPKTPIVIGNGSELTVSYTPNEDLSAGPHNVVIQGCDVEEICSYPKEWTFNIVPQTGTSYIVVHVHNPEGVEINSIEGINPESLGSVRIYDGETYLGSGAFNADTHNKPISITPGDHVIRVDFNGIAKKQTITISPDETKTITFDFERTEFDISKSIDDLNIYESAEINRSFDLVYPPDFRVSDFAGGGDWDKSNPPFLSAYVSGAAEIAYPNYDFAEITGSYYAKATTKLNSREFYLNLVASFTVTKITQCQLSLYGSSAEAGIGAGPGLSIKPITISSQNFDVWYVQMNKDGFYPWITVSTTSIDELPDSPPLLSWWPLENQVEIISSYYEDPNYKGDIFKTAAARKEYKSIQFYLKRISDLNPCCSSISDTSTQEDGVAITRTGTLNNLMMSSVPYDLTGKGIR